MTQNDFPKPLDIDIEEPVEIATYDPVIKNGKVVGLEQGKRTVTQKVRYTKLSEPQKITCTPMNHEWYIPDKHVHLAHCKGCKKRQFIRAVFEKVVDGKIVDRDSGEQLF